MDALTVSIIEGALAKRSQVFFAFKTAFVFGFFQAVMPLLGVALASQFLAWFSYVDHWIAFVLLLILGLRMFADKGIEDAKNVRKKSLLLLAFATSLDALFVGISLRSLVANVYESVAIIGLITFALCFFGFMFGGALKKHFCFCYEKIGGVVLIGIGLKVLFEHLMV